MKAAVCRFKVEFTSLIKVFILHCVRSCYTSCTSWPTAHSCSSFGFIWNHFYGTILLHNPTKGHNELLSMFSCFQVFVVQADRRLFFHYVLKRFPCDGAMADSLVPLWTSVFKPAQSLWPLPAPGWMNRSCTFGFNGAPRAAPWSVWDQQVSSATLICRSMRSWFHVSVQWWLLIVVVPETVICLLIIRLVKRP